MKWISVFDNLPEILKPVLLYTQEGIIQGYRTVNDWQFITLDCHGCGCCGNNGDVVTHWMPLIELPTPKPVYNPILSYRNILLPITSNEIKK